jgi:hypothetical protein
MYSQTPALQPIVPSYHLRILSDEQLDQLKSATLEILEKTGIHCPSEKALNIYAEHGARVDFESQIVKLPSDVVLDSLSHAPRFYTMGARSASHDLKLDGTAFYCATDGCGTKTIDFETRWLRASVKEDVAKMARVADYLSSIGFYWPIVSAQDHPATAPLHELDASFNNTSLGGAGAVCQHATRDLAEFSDFDQIVIGDYNIAAAEKLAAEIGDPRVKVLRVDANDYDGLVRTFRDFDVILNGLPWKYDLAVTRACVEAGVSGLDVSTEESQWEYDAAAKEKGIVFIPGVGATPGITNAMARRPTRGSRTPGAWPSTGRATSTWRTPATTASASSPLTARSRHWLARRSQATWTARALRPGSTSPGVSPWTPKATSTWPIWPTTASARSRLRG